MFRVAVLMSTYNGEHFLNEQINSILSQQNVDVTLFIRDDGSADDTIDIIKKYQTEHTNIILLQGTNLGVGNSFMQLDYSIDDKYDFYAFADQDDIWLPEKLEKAIECIKSASQPMLYASNQRLVDQDLKYIGMRFSSEPDVSYKQILCQNRISGCTMVWNNDLNDLLIEPKRRPSSDLLKQRIHDVWVGMSAAVTGEIYFDMNSYILYRQHDHNVVGAKESTFIDNLRQKLRKLFNEKERNGRSQLAKQIYISYPEYIKEYSLILNTAEYNKKELLKAGNEIITHSGETLIGLKLKILFGVY